MPLVKDVENEIYELEGFRVRFIQGKQDVRGDKKIDANYIEYI